MMASDEVLLRTMKLCVEIRNLIEAEGLAGEDEEVAKMAAVSVMAKILRLENNERTWLMIQGSALLFQDALAALKARSN